MNHPLYPKSLGLMLLLLLVLASPAGAASFPDILVLKDGSEVRGTVMEKKADGSGTFQKFNGELVEFNADTVTYVGAAMRPNQPKAETAPSSPQTESTEGPTPDVSTNIPGVVMYEPGNRQASGAVALGSRGGFAVATGQQEDYRRICVLPGKCSLEARVMELAFRNPHGGEGGLGGHIKTVASIPEGLQNMHVEYISNADTRAFFGWTTLGLVVGGLLLTTTVDPAVGALTVLGGGITVFGMFVEDKVEIRIGKP